MHVKTIHRDEFQQSRTFNEELISIRIKEFRADYRNRWKSSDKNGKIEEEAGRCQYPQVCHDREKKRRVSEVQNL